MQEEEGYVDCINLIISQLFKMQKISGKVVKIEGKRAYIEDINTFNKQLDLLDSGLYQIVIVRAPDALTKMKKYYFFMVSELAKHLGYKKIELHEALKEYVGQTICPTTGKHIYESISDIFEESDMLVRILELQEYAARAHDYVFIDQLEK